MSMKNILVLAVLMRLGTYHSIQAEVIRGVDIPRLNVTRVVGKWYLLTALRKDYELACSTNVIDRQSDDKFTMKVSYTFIPEANKNYPNTPIKPVDIVVDAVIQNDSSVIITRNNGKEKAMVMFDLDHDSYMAVYSAHKKEQIFNGTDGLFYIVGRQKTLPDKIIDKFTQSNFYQQGLKPDAKLIILNTSRCQ